MQTPKRDQFIKQTNKKYFVYMNWVNIKNQNSFCFVISSRATLNETLTAKIITFYPERPKWDQNPKFTSLSETTSIPVHSIWQSPFRTKPSSRGFITELNNASYRWYSMQRFNCMTKIKEVNSNCRRWFKGRTVVLGNALSRTVTL